MTEHDKNSPFMRLVGQSTEKSSGHDTENVCTGSVRCDVHDCDVTINMGVPDALVDRVLVLLDQLIERTE
jgi:hypothetical protein